jgi:uncharacterized protein GlcG (DUF336 family)
MAMGIRTELEIRLARAAARAEAAADRCEKLADLLEMKIAEAEGEPDALERIDAQEEAIMELAEIVGGEE